MADKKKVSQPSQGTEDLGTETNSEVVGRPSAGTDTQLHLAAKSGKKSRADKGNEDVNDDERVVKNNGVQNSFLTSDATDE
ncbi:MAG: hypothetical protein ABIO76_05755 [Ginsengibacter sp.]